MTITIDYQASSAANLEAVWQVLKDLESYPDWNPFVVACRSTLRVGDAIVMRVNLLGFAQPQTETVFEHQENVLLSYGIGLPFGMLASYRSHRVEQQQAGGAVYYSHFQLSGWLSPLVGLLMRGRLKKGFRAMTDAVVREADRRADVAPVIDKV